MTKLRDMLGAAATRPALVQDACEVLDQEVADKGGISGMAIKAAYSVVKGVKPGFIPEVVNGLLDDFLDTLDPLRAQAETQGVPVGDYFKRDPDQVAERLLAITDARVAKADRGVVSKTYEKLRPGAKKHVEAAVPRLAQLVAKHLPQS
jgi:hypothetical protein